MALLSETKAALTTEKTLSSLLASLKGGAGAQATSGFASLLAETGSAKVSADAGRQERSTEQAKETSVTTAEETPAVAAKTKDDSARASATEGERRVREADTAQEEEPVAAKADEDKTTETEVQTEPTDETMCQSAADESSQQEPSDEDMEALLAAIVPLDGSVIKSGLAVDLPKTGSQPDNGALAAMTEKTEATEQVKSQTPEALAAAMDSLSETTGTEKTQTTNEDGAAQTDALNAALDKITDELASITGQKDQKAAAASLKAAPDADGVQQTTSYAAMLATADSQGAGADANQSDSSLDKKMLRDAAAVAQDARTQNTGANSATASQATFQVAALAGQVSSASTGEQTATGSTTQTLGLIGGGVKSAISYDAASQLSAARATRGGAAGLPQAVEQVAVQLHKAAKDGADEITIQLRPAELGKIEIKLEFAADKSVTGTVIADNQATLNMLQKDSDSLQRALQEAGLQANAGCLDFSLRGDGNQNQFAQSQSNDNFYTATAESSAQDQSLSGEAATDVETYYLTPGRVNLHV